MDNYRRMYFILFNAITESLGILMEAQAEAERLYVEESRDTHGNVIPFPDTFTEK